MESQYLGVRGPVRALNAVCPSSCFEPVGKSASGLAHSKG
jgi:hypothetical protein